MKKNKTKNIKDIFAFGGAAMNIDSPSESLSKFQKVSQEALAGSMSDPSVAGLKGFGAIATGVGMSMASKGMASKDGTDLKGMDKFLFDNFDTITSLANVGQGFSMSHAMGGSVDNVNINAEGQEVVETPNGMVGEIQGPSHEGGGVDMQVPEGTEIYSKRLIGKDGNTMADRKKLREKELSRVQKLLDKDPNNRMLKKTLERIQNTNNTLDSQDLEQMEVAKSMSQQMGQIFADGGYASNILPNGKYKNPAWVNNLSTDMLDDNYGFVDLENLQTASKTDNNYYYNKGTVTADKNKGYYSTEEKEDLGLKEDGSFKKNFNFDLSKYFGDYTLGDAMGMGANFFGANAQMRNTYNNRAATPAEQNAFKNYGDAALKKIQSQYGYIDGIRTQKLQDLESSRQGAVSRNNNSARSINTARALNLATDAQVDSARSDIYDQFAAQTMSIIGQEAGQLNANDQARMQGEDRRAERELQNTDNFYSNMARNISDKYRSVGETGKSLNDVKERGTTNDLMQSFYRNIGYDPINNKWITRKDADVQNVGNDITQNIRKNEEATNTTLYNKQGKVNRNIIKDIDYQNYGYNTEDAFVKALEDNKDNKWFLENLQESNTDYKKYTTNKGSNFKSNKEFEEYKSRGYEAKLNTDKYRPDGSEKGKGFYGILKSNKGADMTEYSVGIRIDGKETDVPTLIPGLTKKEIEYLKTEPDAKNIPDALMKKISDFAKKRKKEGKSYFAEPYEEFKTKIPTK